MLDLGENGDSSYIDMHAPTVSIHSDVANKPVFNIKNTNADANGAVINLIKDSASPADNDDIGRIYMRGDNDAGEQMEGVMLRGQMTDVTDGTEDSKLTLYTYGAGAQIPSLILEGGQATFSGNVDITGTDYLYIGGWVRINNPGSGVFKVGQYNGSAWTDTLSITNAGDAIVEGGLSIGGGAVTHDELNVYSSGTKMGGLW